MSVPAALARPRAQALNDGKSAARNRRETDLPASIEQVGFLKRPRADAGTRTPDPFITREFLAVLMSRVESCKSLQMRV